MHTNRKLFRRVTRNCGVATLSSVLSVLLFWCPLSHAGDIGTISGSVLDPSGSAVPGATVLIDDSVSGLQRTTATDDDGFYSFYALPTGRYDVEIHAAGFKPYRQTGLELNADLTLRVDAKLQLNSESTIVEVSADALHVDLSSTQSGELIAGKQISSIPLNGRSFTNLLSIQAGVVPASSQQPNAVVMAGAASTPPSGDLDAGNLSVSGQRQTTNGFLLNGSTIQEAFNMGTAIVPNLDSIQEFRVLTNNFDSEYGNYSGGQVVVVTKSGGDQLHGSAFEFFRNTSLDAKNYFSTDRAKFDRHQFGGTLGGPIQRGKTFFFLDYQGTRMTQGIETGLISVPSALERGGDFSDLTSALTGSVNGQSWANSLSQKLGYAVSPGELYYTQGCVSPSQCVFPYARIPQSVLSEPANHLLTYIPEPNQGTN